MCVYSLMPTRKLKCSWRDCSNWRWREWGKERSSLRRPFSEESRLWRGNIWGRYSFLNGEQIPIQVFTPDWKNHSSLCCLFRIVSACWLNLSTWNRRISWGEDSRWQTCLLRYSSLLIRELRWRRTSRGRWSLRLKTCIHKRGVWTIPVLTAQNTKEHFLTKHLSSAGTLAL